MATNQQWVAILAVVTLPIITVAVSIYRPALAAYVIVAAAVGLAIAVEHLSRSVHRVRMRHKSRQIIAIAVALGVLAITDIGVITLRAGNADWSLIILGAAAGGLLGGGLVIASVIAENRPRLARGLVFLVVIIAVVAGARGMGHLIGVAPQPSQATLAAGGFLGLFVVLGFFGVKEIL